MLVTTSWLADHLSDPKLVVLPMGQKSEYDQAHIPGSRFLDYVETHTMPASQTELTLELLPMPELVKVLRREE